MSYGATSYRSDGRANIVPDGFGGVFVGRYQFAVGSGYVRTSFPGLFGMSIIAFHVFAGNHTFTTGVDGSGIPYLDVTSQTTTPYSSKSVFGVFAR